MLRRKSPPGNKTRFRMEITGSSEFCVAMISIPAFTLVVCEANAGVEMLTLICASDCNSKKCILALPTLPHPNPYSSNSLSFAYPTPCHHPAQFHILSFGIHKSCRKNGGSGNESQSILRLLLFSCMLSCVELCCVLQYCLFSCSCFVSCVVMSCLLALRAKV